MKIFGLGLNKTGTTTLGYCFSQLGYKHLSCLRDLLIAYREGRLEDVFAVIDQYDTFEDWPYPLMYRELYNRYPDAKFVLTVRRDADTWLRSLKKHSIVTSHKTNCRPYAYGFEYPFGHEEEHLAFYKKHNENVVTFFEEKGASDRLLNICWEEGTGWQELTAFLGVEAPFDKIPKMNSARKISWRDPVQLTNRWRAGFWGKP